MKNNLSKIFNSGENKLLSLLKFGTFIFTKPGRKLLMGKLGKAVPPIDYDTWVRAQSLHAYTTSTSKETYKISIVLSVYESSIDTLNAAVDSVLAQTWPAWELLILSAGIEPDVANLAKKDGRISIIPSEVYYPAPPAASDLLRDATGSYVLFMRQDDVLASDCLAAFCSHIDKYLADGIIYADEDIMDSNGRFSQPYFKSGWAPDSLLSRNYIGDNIVVKKELLDRLVKTSAKCDSFYDLNLQLTEIAGSVGHIPLVLFHHKAHDLSVEDDVLSKRALGAALRRRHTQGIVSSVAGVAGCYHVNYEIAKKERVSIIIPTKDNTALLKKTIDSVLQKTDYPDYEILVLNNNSQSDEFFALMKEYGSQQPGRFRCIDANFPFNFAKLMNVGAQYSTGAYLLLLNNDVEVLHADWMTQMVSYAQHKSTGAVGVKLLYPDDTIQHAGIVLGGDEGAGHVHANCKRDDNGYFGALKAVTNYAAVTAACLMCRKEIFNEVSGMDEALAVEYNDIDLCLSLLSRGYYNVYLPSVALYHYESATRGHPFRSSASWKQHERELGIFKRKWQGLIDDDPFYNGNRRLAFMKNE